MPNFHPNELFGLANVNLSLPNHTRQGQARFETSCSSTVSVTELLLSSFSSVNLLCSLRLEDSLSLTLLRHYFCCVHEIVCLQSSQRASAVMQMAATANKKNTIVQFSLCKQYTLPWQKYQFSYFNRIYACAILWGGYIHSVCCLNTICNCLG